MNNSTIAAVATPDGPGGIGIIKISGPRAVSIAKAIFTHAESNSKSLPGNYPSPENICGGCFQSHKLYLGYIIDPENRRTVDEVLLCTMKAPRSYTKEDVVEINAHGGQVAVNAILELVLKQGARIAEPGEFTKRAFLNGRIDLTQAEAVIDIINARTEKSLRVAASQVTGQLKTTVEKIRERLVEFLIRVEADIDFPEDVSDMLDSKRAARDIEERVIQTLKTLIQCYQEGHLLREGLKVTVAGRPNVGKSSLLNRLIHKDRAIVTAVPGTTRDTIEETLNIRGFPVIIADTAGMHETKDPIETLGIKKTIEKIQSSDMVIFMVEANRSLTEDDHRIFQKVKSKPIIIAMNKIDLVKGQGLAVLPDSWRKNDCVEISALYDRGIEQLKEKIIFTGFGKRRIDSEPGVLPNLRHKLLLEDSLRETEIIIRELGNNTPMELIAIHLQDAIDFLGQILGTNVRLDILDQIFSRFCIGK